MKVGNIFSYKGNTPDKEWPNEDNIQKMKIADSNGGAEYSEKLTTYQTKVWNNQTVNY